MQNLIKFHQFVQKILSRNKILIITKVHLQKWTGNNPKVDLVNINAYEKFGLIVSIRSQDIERKQYSENNQGP